MYNEHAFPEYAALLEGARAARARAASTLITRGARTLGRAALSFPVALLRKVALWHQRRGIAHELQGLDDRSLKDIGLYRGDIGWVAEAVSLGLDPKPQATRPVAVAPAEIIHLRRSDAVPIRRAA